MVVGDPQSSRDLKVIVEVDESEEDPLSAGKEGSRNEKCTRICKDGLLEGCLSRLTSWEGQDFGARWQIRVYHISSTDSNSAVAAPMLYEICELLSRSSNW